MYFTYVKKPVACLCATILDMYESFMKKSEGEEPTDLSRRRALATSGAPTLRVRG